VKIAAQASVLPLYAVCVHAFVSHRRVISCFVVSYASISNTKLMTYASHEWLPSVAGSLHPLLHSLG
jgi:hypothetical protein